MDITRILDYVLYGMPIRGGLKFAICCGFVGLGTFVVDLIIYKLKQKTGPSLLGIHYVSHTALKFSNWIVACIAWSMGSFIVGGAGFFARIFQAEPAAIMGVGIFWPFLFTKWVKSGDSDNNAEEETDDEEGEPV